MPFLFTLLSLLLVSSAYGQEIREIGRVETADLAHGVVIVGDYAYVADYREGLRIIDVSEPAEPEEVGFIDTPGLAYDVVVEGEYAYVVDAQAGLQVVNIADPTDPAEAGSLDTPGMAHGISVVEQIAYVADGNGGLRIIDVTQPDSLFEIASIDTIGIVSGISVLGDLAYLACGYAGLKIVDISSPAEPELISSGDTEEMATDIFVSGDIAYLACREEGLVIFDVSDPEEPVEVAVCDSVGVAFDVVVEDGFAYVGDQSFGFHIVDVSNPEEPFRVGGYDTEDAAYGLVFSDEYLYVADHAGGLSIYDCSEVTDGIPVITVSADSLDFGELIIGQSLERNLTISNEGEVTLELYDVIIDSESFYTEFRDPIEIEPDSSVDIAIGFVPEDTVLHEGQLTILSNDRHNDSLTVYMRGRGLPMTVSDEVYLPNKIALTTYPNPFNSKVTIVVMIDDLKNNLLFIFDVNGRKIADLRDGITTIGKNEIIWDASGLADGSYNISLQTENKTISSIITLIK